MKQLLLNLTPSEYKHFMSYLSDPANKGIIELVTRNASSRFLPFAKATISDYSEGVQKAVQSAAKAQKANDSQNITRLLSAAKQMNGKLDNVLDYASQIPNLAAQVDQICNGMQVLTNLSWVNVGLSLLNVGTSVVGFAVMSRKLSGINITLDGMNTKLDHMNGKLDSISSRIDEISFKLDELDKKIEDVRKAAETTKNIALQQLTSSQKKKLLQKAKVFLADFDENRAIDHPQLVTAITDMEVYLEDLIELSSQINPANIYTAIHLLMPVYTQLICIYYTLFIREYRSNSNPLHRDWMNIYDLLCNRQFISNMEDFYFLTEHLHNREIQKLVKIQYLLSMNGRIQVEDARQLAIFKNSEEYSKLHQTLENYAIVEAAQDLLGPLKEEFEEDEALEMLRDTLRERFEVEVEVAG